MDYIDNYRRGSVSCTNGQEPGEFFNKPLEQTVALRKKPSRSLKFHERSAGNLQQVALEVKDIVGSLDDIPESLETRNRTIER